MESYSFRINVLNLPTSCMTSCRHILSVHDVVWILMVDGAYAPSWLLTAQLSLDWKLTLWVFFDVKTSLIIPNRWVFFDVLTSFKNYFEIFIENNLTSIKLSMSCCRVRGVFQAPQAACGRSVTRHSLPEVAFKIPTCSVVILPSRSLPPALSKRRKDSEG